MRSLFLVCIVIFGLATHPTSVFATENSLEQAAAIPHVSKKARDEYLSYSVSEQHRAFAISPGGAWGWVANQTSIQQAKDNALSSCEQHSKHRCILYAVNDRVVFDKGRWAGLWGPYLNAEQAARKRLGRQIGEQFYDLKFLDNQGGEKTLSQLRGKVVLLHFWGSWCPPCMQEFPSLLTLNTTLEAELGEQVAMILLQVREPYNVSKTWATKQGFGSLALFNSMNDGHGAKALQLAEGGTVPDRYLAPVFPASYVIDRNGIVIFRHSGAIKDWLEFLPFFKHAAEAEDN